MPAANAPSPEPSEVPSIAPIASTSSAEPTQLPSRVILDSLSQTPSNTIRDAPSLMPSVEYDTIIPSGAPNTPPSILPSAAPSRRRSRRIIAEFVGVTMTFTGMLPLSDESVTIWKEYTENYFRDFFSEQVSNSIGISVVISFFDLTAQDPRFSGRLLARSLQQRQQVTITYTQQLSFYADNSTISAEQVAQEPFLLPGSRRNYIRELIFSTDPAFRGIDDVSMFAFAKETAETDNGLSKQAVISIGVGVGGCALAILICAFVYTRSLRWKRHLHNAGTVSTQLIVETGDVGMRIEDSRQSPLAAEGEERYVRHTIRRVKGCTLLQAVLTSNIRIASR